MRLFAVRLWSALCCLHLALTLAQDRHLPTTRRLRAHLAAVDADTARLSRQADELRRQVSALKSPLGAESAVRDELGWVRRGEVLLLPEPDAVYSQHAPLSQTPRSG